MALDWWGCERIDLTMPMPPTSALLLQLAVGASYVIAQVSIRSKLLGSPDARLRERSLVDIEEWARKAPIPICRLAAL